MKSTKILAILTILLISSSCNKTNSEQHIEPDGIWKQNGYGRYIGLNDTTIKIYDITKRNCNLSYEKEILDFGEIKSFTKDTLIIQHGIDNWLFTRAEKLPERCNSSNETVTDPMYNFQALWETFNENYASFEIKEIDWDEIYHKYEPIVTENTTDVELYSIFQKMTGVLNDGHVEIEVPESIKEEYDNQAERTTYRYSKLDEWQLNKEIAELYVDSLRNYNAGMIRYGLVNGNIGYVQINSMLMLADYSLPKNLDLRNFYNQYWEIAENSKNEIQRQEEVEGVNQVLDHIIQELKGAESYILDLRFNGGGKDGVALAILNHFSDTEKVGFTKKARSKNGFTEKQEIRIVPSEVRFTGKVYLLTSHLTASASEILVLASLENSNFTRIGSSTEGIFSSTLDKKLPNGWEYDLSNEVYQDLKGNNYENEGIKPDYALDYSTNKDIFFDQLSNEVKNEKDSAIDLVIELEKKQ